MSLFDVIKVTLPCRRCGTPLTTQIRRSTAEQSELDQTNLRARCPEHGITEMMLQIESAGSDEHWSYKNKHGVEMGRGETPQGAINSFHGEALNDELQEEKETYGEPHLTPRPISELAEELQEDDPEQSRKARILGGVSRMNSQETVKSQQKDQVDSPTEANGGGPNSSFRSLEDIPRWFRSQPGSIEWLVQILQQDRDLKQLFDHRYVLVTKGDPERSPQERQFIGFSSLQQLKKRCQKCVFSDEDVVLIRDQEKRIFLEPQVEIQFKELREDKSVPSR